MEAHRPSKVLRNWISHPRLHFRFKLNFEGGGGVEKFRKKLKNHTGKWGAGTTEKCQHFTRLKRRSIIVQLSRLISPRARLFLIHESSSPFQTISLTLSLFSLFTRDTRDENRGGKKKKRKKEVESKVIGVFTEEYREYVSEERDRSARREILIKRSWFRNDTI